MSINPFDDDNGVLVNDEEQRSYDDSQRRRAGTTSPDDTTRGMSDPMPVEPTTLHHTRNDFPTHLPRGRFVAAVSAIGAMQLQAGMDGTVTIVALPKIQNDLGLSDAGRSWVISASMLTFARADAAGWPPG